MKKAIIFDMDGTLWDSIENIIISWNHALDRLGEYEVRVTRQRIEGLMGKTMDAFAKELLPHHPLDKAMKMMHILEEEENDYLRVHGAELLGDVERVFQELQNAGYEVHIVSNCQAGYIEAFLDYYHLNHLVTDLECYGNTKQGKADNLKALIQRNQLEQYWYLGDTQGDFDACREAEVPFLFAAYGFGSVDAEVPSIASLEELVPYLNRLENK